MKQIQNNKKSSLPNQPMDFNNLKKNSVNQGFLFFVISISELQALYTLYKP
jgi:hypothetical protein